MIKSLHETALGFNRQWKKSRQVWVLVRALSLLFIIATQAGCGEGLEGDLSLLKDDLDQDSLHRAIDRSLGYLEKLPPDRIVGEWPRKFAAREIKESLLSFQELLRLWDQPDKLVEEIRSRFEFLPSEPEGQEGEVLFTGYFQPILEGSLTETPTYRFPIYRGPDDLNPPYLSRHEIDGLGRLRGKGYEIAWVRDAVELFFLHVQGSGILRLEDGQLLHLNYAASNGRPYRSIGKILIDQAKIPQGEMSMQRLQRYLREHPGERDALLAQNESYVFFRFVNQGPLGSLEVPLTPGRSLATDSRLFPKGGLALIISQRPILDSGGELLGWQPFSRFVLNQDTGNAIQGPRRADLYFGAGYEAGLAAGVMKSPGKIYFLIQKKTGEK